MKPISIFLVAGEESGDRLGASLMRALKRRHADISFGGTGGRGMEAEGLHSLFPIDEIAIVGIAAIPRRLRMILRRIRETARAIVAAKPDALVIIDSPDFTHRVARRVRAADPTIPILDYVSPSVWAWRPGRARAMRRYVDRVLAILPFEPAVHLRLGGPPCAFVGHPLAQELDELRPNEEEKRRRMSDPAVLLVLPGSRSGEIGRMLPVFSDAVTEVLRGWSQHVEVIIPTVPHLADRIARETAGWASKPQIVVDPVKKRAAFRIARCALAKSGTVTLELALAGVPMVAAYRISGLEYAIAKQLIKVQSVILANLVLNENAVPEFLQAQCTPRNLAGALLPLLAESPQRRAQLAAFACLDTIMEIGKAAPADRAADAVLAQIGEPQPRIPAPKE
jgi:lipid-A-disaccharide synthase